MDLSCYPEVVQKIISELLKRGTLNEDQLSDKTLINYLLSQKFDNDIFENVKNDRL